MSSSPTDTAMIDVTMPQMGVSVVEGTLVEWKKAIGDQVARDEIICAIATDKIDTDVESPAAGTLAEILVQVGELSGDTETDFDGTTQAPTMPRPRGRYSPVVMRIAQEHGIDLDAVQGTGRNGRVRKRDVLAALENGSGSNGGEEPPMHIESPYRPDEPVAPKVRRSRLGGDAAAPAPAASAGPVAMPAGSSGPLSRMRQSIGKAMVHSLQTAATCTTIVEADLSAVERVRKELGVTYLPVMARATIETLREYPELNATLEGDTHTTYDAVHLGVAVSLGTGGLIVPVIHDAQELSIEGLAARIKDLAHLVGD